MTENSPPALLASDTVLYREGLRKWLESGNADEWRHYYAETAIDGITKSGKLVELLYGAGWGRYGWPAAVGGLGGDERHLGILYDELGRRGIPIPEQYTVLQVLGPMIVEYAPDLADRYLGAFLQGGEWWGQGFSEPEAGSDLASLRTRAVRDGENYRISGTKLWTSHGVGAARMVVLARTGTAESRHRGLSMFLVDSNTPGLEIRPIALANGREELAEVFYEDVVVPSDRLIGEENEGWYAAMYLMQYERGLYAWLRSSALLSELDLLAGQVYEFGQNDAHSRQVLGEAYLDVAALHARSSRTVRSLAEGGTIGPEASADKLLLGRAEISVLDAARELLGADFLFNPACARWRDDWWFSRTTTIYGGSAEVQRKILADKVLKLPSEGAR